MSSTSTVNGHGPTVRVMLVALPLVSWGLERLLETGAPRLSCEGVVASVAEGLLHLERVRPDVVLLDLDGEEGTESLAHLHARGIGRVLVITGSRDPLVHDSAVIAGARGVLDKREPPQVLLKAIEKVNEGEMWIDRSATGRIFMELARQKVMPGRDPEHERMAQLTPRERQTVVALANDASSPGKVIAEQLHISEHTLRNHLTSIYSKLGVSSRMDLYAFALRNGLRGG